MMDNLSKIIEEQHSLMAIYIKLLCEMFNAQKLEMRSESENKVYKAALSSVMNNIQQHTDTHASSARQRKSLMAQTLMYLMKELENSCGMKKFKNMEAADVFRALVNAISRMGKMYLPCTLEEDPGMEIVSFGAPMVNSENVSNQ